MAEDDTGNGGFEQYVLGEHRDTLQFERRGENRAVVEAMLRQARRSIEILTPDLEAPVYDTTPAIEAITQLSMRSRFSQIRVLVQDPARLMKHGHRLVETARRLSSSIALHKPGPHDLEFEHSFLVVDATGYVHKNISARYTGTANFNDPLQARKLLKSFNELWEHSEPDPEFRRLHL